MEYNLKQLELKTARYRPIVRLANLLIVLMGVGVLFSVFSLVTFFVRTSLNHELQFYSSYYLAGAFFRLFLLVLLTSGLVFLRRYVFQFVRQQEELAFLKEKEDRLASAVSGAHEGLWDWDIKSGHVYYSDRFKEILGYEILPCGDSIETFNALLHPEDKDGAWDALNQHFDSHEMFSERFRLRMGSGDYRWFHSRGFAEYNANGEAVRMSGLLRDVTSQVNLEKALAEASRQVKGVTTTEIFESIADFLAKTLNIHYVIIARIYKEEPEMAHMLVFKAGENFEEPFSYNLAGSPCQEVYLNRVCIHECSICELFPDDPYLTEMNAESYAGISLTDSKGEVIGLLALVDTEPFEDEAYVRLILDLFATRASSTLERHIVEEKLADSHQRSQRIFELGLVGMAISTKSKSFLEVNDRFCEMLGYSREEFEKLTWQEITHEDDIAMSQKMFEQMISGEVESYSVDKRYVHRDGHVLHVQLAVKGVLDEHGEVDYVVALVDDVTEKVEALQKLKENEELYRSYFELNLVGAVMFDGEGRITEANNAFCEMMGYDRNELNMMHWTALTHPDDLEQCTLKVTEIVEGDITRFAMQKRYMHQSGEEVHVITSVTGMRDESGEVKCFFAVIQDISQRVEALEQLKDREARYRGYFEMGLIGMAISGVNKEWIEVNDRICEMIGYSREELMEMTWDEVSHPDEKRQNEALFKQAMNGEIDRYSLEKKFYRKDGGLIHVYASVAAVRDERGDVDYFVTAFQDITERIREDERRQRMINELDHRVKNNLASVLSLANLSIQASSSLESFEENFTGRILALASAHEQLAARQWENVPLAEMIVQTLSPYVGENISVNELEAGDVKVALEGEEIMLQSKQTSALSLAVHELVTNAVKYGALSEPDGRMHIEWGVEGGQLNIDWVENDLSSVDLESKCGVGLNITKGMIEFELDGEFEIQFSNHCVRVGMCIPLEDETEADKEATADQATPVLNETFEKLSPLIKKN